MPRARSPNRDKAKELWLKSDKTRQLKDIAKELGVSEEQVRKWKSQDNWENEGKVTLPNKKANPKSKRKGNVTKRTPGGQPGNKNASGSHPGAPPGNTNNYRHGFFYDVLEPEEQAFVDARESITEAHRLLNQLDLWEIKERRLLRDLAELRTLPSGLIVQSVTKFKKDASTTAITVKEYIIRLETLLTQAQRGYMYCIKELHQIKMDMERLQLMKLQAGIGENNAEDEAAQEVLMKAIKRALKDEN